MSQAGFDVESFAVRLTDALTPVKDQEKAMSVAARVAQKSYSAEERMEVRLRTNGDPQVAIKDKWDPELVASFLSGDRPQMPSNVMFAVFRRRGRPWKLVGFRNDRRKFPRSVRRSLQRLEAAVNDRNSGLDLSTATTQVRQLITRSRDKTPRDATYLALHKIRTETGYDHSSLVLRFRTERTAEIWAEQITWDKVKSQRIRDTLPIDASIYHDIHRGEVSLHERRGKRWESGRLPSLAPWLSSLFSSDGPTPRAVVFQPIIGRGGSVLGALVFAANQTDLSTDYCMEIAKLYVPLLRDCLDSTARLVGRLLDRIEEFRGLLDSDEVCEADVHSFLKENPFLLYQTAREVHSEVEIGDGRTDYRIDMMIRTPNDSYIVVELESPAKEIFRKDGQFRAEVTQAVHQVECWQQWFAENLRVAADRFPGLRATPHGMVVIGRHNRWDASHAKKLARRNKNSRGYLIIKTYDDLVEEAYAFVDTLRRALGG